MLVDSNFKRQYHDDVKNNLYSLRATRFYVNPAIAYWSDKVHDFVNAERFRISYYLRILRK